MIVDDLVLARSLFGTTMGFHIIFATLGVGLPLMILMAELIYQKTKDPHYAIMAKTVDEGAGCSARRGDTDRNDRGYTACPFVARIHGSHRQGDVTPVSD